MLKKSVVVMLLPALLALLGCRERKAAEHAPGTPNTQTIAPAQADPSPTGTDAMTQTVDVEDGRSEEDGGVITSKQTAKTPKMTTTTTATTTHAPPKKKKS